MSTQLERDRDSYYAWVAAQLDRVHSYGGNGFDVWDTSKLRRARIERDEHDAYRGPWRTVRPYATQEFIWWIESYGEPRYTFTEWQARAKADRLAESTAVSEWHESAGYCLSELEMLSELLNRRAELIYQARERGASWAEVTTAAGMSRMQAHTLAKGYAAAIQIPIVEVQEPNVEYVDVDGELCLVF